MNSFSYGELSVKVVLSNEAAAKYKIPAFIPCAFMDTDEDGNHFIVVTDGFYALTEQTQKCILTHELGHLSLGHMTDTPKDEMVMNAQIEAEADAWASYIVGKEEFEKAVYESAAVTLDQLGNNGINLTPEIRTAVRAEANKRIADRDALMV